jgi:cathepsin E
MNIHEYLDQAVRTVPSTLERSISRKGFEACLHYLFSLHGRPVTTTSPASEFWGITETITYGTSTMIMPSTVGIVDAGKLRYLAYPAGSPASSCAGTTLLLLATDAYQRYVTATGAVQDISTSLLRITNAQFSNLKSLFFTINGVDISISTTSDVRLIFYCLYNFRCTTRALRTHNFGPVRSIPRSVARPAIST